MPIKLLHSRAGSAYPFGQYPAAKAQLSNMGFMTAEWWVVVTQTYI